ncbi:MAG: hypothetical protein Kow0019_05140 [Methanobacteriaceae archaeon]
MGIILIFKLNIPRNTAITIKVIVLSKLKSFNKKYAPKTNAVNKRDIINIPNKEWVNPLCLEK